MSVPYAKILLSNNERQQMTNEIRVPHTIVFEAIINLDTIPANLLPALIALDEATMTQMCKEATLHALHESNVLQTANEFNTWAEMTIKEGN
jgi:hypothetical protein